MEHKWLALFFAFTHLCCIAFAIAAAVEYQKVDFTYNCDRRSGRCVPHSMFKVVDIMYVAAGIKVGLGLHLLIRELRLKRTKKWYTQPFVQAFIIFKSFVPTFLICGTWCGFAVIDSFGAWSGAPTAWDAANESIEPHMRAAFATHTVAVGFAFVSFSSTIALLFENSVDQYVDNKIIKEDDV